MTVTRESLIPPQSEDLAAPGPQQEPLALAAARTGDAWLRSSGIQHERGGFHSWFDRATGEYPFLYAEVTGYQVTHAVWRATRGDGTALGAAERAVEWLTSAVQGAPGSFRCLEPFSVDAHVKSKADRCYTFDAGIILQGLVAHHVATGNEQALRTSLDTGTWLLAHSGPDGVYIPWPSTGTDESWEDAPADWSTRPGVHHAKIGIGLAALGEVTGDRRFTRAAVAACTAALPHQRPSGRFVTNPVTDSTNIHPHCYAAEALWAVGTAAGRDDLVAASEKATRWALRVTDEAGYPPRRWTPYQPAVHHPRVDGVSQVLRLAALHGRQTSDVARRITETLLSYQVLDEEEPRVHGGFTFGASSAGAPLPHVNVWVTAFASQALVLAHEAGASLDWRLLV